MFVTSPVRSRSVRQLGLTVLAAALGLIAGTVTSPPFGPLGDVTVTAAPGGASGNTASDGSYTTTISRPGATAWL